MGLPSPIFDPFAAQVTDRKPVLSRAAYYAFRRKHEQGFVVVNNAHRAMVGEETMVSQPGGRGCGIFVTPAAPSYYVTAWADEGYAVSYLIDARDFEKTAINMDAAPLAVPKKELPADARVIANERGYIIQTADETFPCSWGHWDFHCTFNMRAGALEGPDVAKRTYTLFADARQPLLRGVVLHEAEVFEGRDGRREEAPAGSVLYVNPASPDGLSLMSEDAARRNLRLPVPPRGLLSPGGVSLAS